MVGVHRGNKQGRDRGDPERKTRSKMPPGGHLRPLGGGFLITVAAHKCGLHRGKCCNYIFVHGLCLSAQMRIASGKGNGSAQYSLALPQRTNADCIGNIAQKCDILFCRLRCESVDSFSGITKDACADYFPVLFYCQGNQRCHYRQSRTDNRPVFYGANCTGFFCKLLLRTYARMLLRIPILESVFGISDNLRID